MNQTSLKDLSDRLRQVEGSSRYITAIAGAPGSGKSTLADRLATSLNQSAPGTAEVFPMDGYHYDDHLLDERGWRARKGAPHTFDVAGFFHTLKRLRGNTEPAVAVPVFDRAIEIARAGARLINSSVRHVIVEGNYLLLDQDPWNSLPQLFDLTVFLDVPEPVLEARLTERWKALAPDDFRTKMEGNDLPNARLVARHSRTADITLDNG